MLKAPSDIARWVPLSTTQTENKMVGHDVICLHTMVGYLLSVDRIWRADGYTGLESHFGVGGKWGPDAGGFDGVVFQWQDLHYQADANLDGNPYVISIETADNGFEPIQPWTPKQIDAIVELCNWLCSVEAHLACPPTWLCHTVGIPKVLIPNTIRSNRGIGYHRQGIVGNYPDHLVVGGVRWSKATGKTCPTDARIEQIKRYIIPRLQAMGGPAQEDELAYYTVITGPKKPPRVFVDGSLVGFPNQTEMVEYLAPFKREGYAQRDIAFAEADDWQRYMDGIGAADQRIELRLVDLQNRLGKIEAWVSAQPSGTMDEGDRGGPI